MRILIVDDSPIVRKAVKKELAHLNFELQEEGNPLVALERVEAEEFDLITLDVDMPEMNGYEVCRRIRALTDRKKRETDIVFITGRDTLDGRLKGFEVGGTNFLTKSFSKGQLSEIVSGLLKPECRFRDHTILLVDDSELVLQSLRRGLNRYGAKLLEALSGEEAFEIAKQHQAELSMVITDYSMPGMNGDELCAKLRSEVAFKRLPILFLSADGTRKRKLDMFRAGANDYIEKPFILEELLARIEAQLIQIEHLREIGDLNEDLRSANESLKSFVAMASHDLRSPVGNVQSLMEAILDEWEESDKESQLELIHMAKDTSERALYLIDSLLRYSTSSSKSLAYEQFSLMDVCDAVLRDLQFKIDSSQASITVDELPAVWGDRSLISQVFQNLIGNALKYQVEGNNPLISISLEKPSDSGVTICFADNGIGFEQEKAEELFKPFTRGTTEERFEGSGVGLGTVRNIVNRHGGKVWATSVPGQGSKFYLRLPLELIED